MLCINYRAIVAANYTQVFFTDATIAGFNFLIIKKIADANREEKRYLAAYVAGSLLGSFLGIWASQRISNI